MIKQSFDRAVAAFLLLLCMPIMAAITCAVKLDSSGPLLFRQPRYGYGRRVVWITKFRTMRAESADIVGRLQATVDDDRVTRVGRFLRSTCLDELPQLVDVLCGRMSLVGPRPHPLDLELNGVPLDRLIPAYHERHQVRPGITGLAQIRGNRGPVKDLDMGIERVRYDLEYIRRSSFWLDLAILSQTLVVPFQRGRSF